MNEITPIHELSQKKQQFIEEKNQMLANNDVTMQIIGIIRIEGAPMSKCRAVMYCEKHGDTSKFGTPYLPLISNLGKLKNVGCNKCSGKYSPSKEEVLVEMKQALENVNCEFVGFVNEYTGRYSKVWYRTLCCNDKQKTSINAVVNGRAGCRECGLSKAWENKLATGREVLAELKEKYADFPFEFRIDLDKRYKGEDEITCFCLKHKKKITKSYRSFRHDTDINSHCPDCSREIKIYNMTFTYEEQLARVGEVMKDTPWTFELPNVDKGNESYATIYCPMHNHKFDARIGNIMSNHFGCVYCGNDKHHLQTLFRSTQELLYSPRHIYNVHFLHTFTGKTFYKIGVAGNNLSARYSPKQLQKDGLVITGTPFIYKTDSLTALLVEAYLLFSAEYVRYRIDVCEMMQALGGGLEGFTVSLLEDNNINTFIEKAYAAHRTILSYCLKGEQLKKALAMVNLYQKQKGMSVGEANLKVVKRAKERKAVGMTQKELFLALTEHGFALDKTAKALGLNRSTMRNKLKRFSLYEIFQHIKKTKRSSERFNLDPADYLK